MPVRGKRAEMPMPAESDSTADLQSESPSQGAAAVVIPLPVGYLPRELRAAQLLPSPLNPRRTPSSPEADRELEDSIVANGLLQPIVVRPASLELLAECRRVDGAFHAPKAIGSPLEHFEIICGERRWKAIQKAELGGRLPEDWPVPVRIREASDEDLIVLAGTENLEREDMHPLDEAMLFDSLRPYIKARNPKAVAAREIAARFHVSERKVYTRLRLLRLTPKLMTALRDDKLQLQQAEALALGDPADQDKAIAEVVESNQHGYPTDPAELRLEMLHARAPKSAAAFDLERYTGEFIESEGEDGVETYFADMKQFKRLQEAARDEAIAALKKKFPWARTLKKSESEHGFRKVAKTDPEAGALVFIDHGFLLQVLEPVIDPETARKREAKGQDAGRHARTSERGAIVVDGEPVRDVSIGPRQPKRYMTDGQSIFVKRAKTQAIRQGLAMSAHATLALLCLALLDPDSEVNLRADNAWHARREENNFPPSEVEADLLRERLKAGGDLKVRASSYGSRSASRAQAETFRKLMKRKPAELVELLQSLLGPRVGDWFDGHDHRMGDSELAIAVAEAVGAGDLLPHLWKPTEEYFKAHGRGYLEALALATGAYAVDLPKLKKGELAKSLAGRAWKPEQFIECHFATGAEMKAAFKTLEQKTAAATAAPKRKPKSAPAKPVARGRQRDAKASSRKPAQKPKAKSRPAKAAKRKARK